MYRGCRAVNDAAHQPVAGSGKPLSVLVMTSTYPRWTGDRNPNFVHELSRRLVALGMRVDVLAPRAPGSQKREAIDGVDVYRYPYFINRWETLAYGGGILPNLKQNPLRYAQVPFFLLAQWLALRERIRAKDYDVVHAHWVIPQGVVAAFARGSDDPPLTITSHGGDFFGLRSGPLERCKLRAFSQSRLVTVVSNAMQELLESTGQLENTRVAVLPMGVDLSTRYTVDPSVERVADQVIFVGRLVEKKGVRYLIEAMKTVRKSHPGIRLDIVGDGPSRPELEDRVRDLDLGDTVQFLGTRTQDELPSLLRRATLAVVPSIVASSGDQEGLGLVTVEAMGCGCPVVASDLPAIRDVVIDGVTGRMATPADTEALAQAINDMLDDPALRVELAGNARRHVVEHFDWDFVASRYETELMQIAAVD